MCTFPFIRPLKNYHNPSSNRHGRNIAMRLPEYNSSLSISNVWSNLCHLICVFPLQCTAPPPKKTKQSTLDFGKPKSSAPAKKKTTTFLDSDSDTDKETNGFSSEGKGERREQWLLIILNQCFECDTGVLHLRN